MLNLQPFLHPSSQQDYWKPISPSSLVSTFSKFDFIKGSLLKKQEFRLGTKHN